MFGAPSGSAALEVMRQNRIDLFFLDIDMPGMNGFELTDKIRASENHARTPIIFFTAHSSRANIKKSMELGIRDFIVKPSFFETLQVKANKYLG